MKDRWSMLSSSEKTLFKNVSRRRIYLLALKNFSKHLWLQEVKFREVNTQFKRNLFLKTRRNFEDVKFRGYDAEQFLPLS